MMKKLHYIFVLLTILAIHQPVTANICSPPLHYDPLLKNNGNYNGGNNGTNGDDNKFFVNSQITVSNLYPNPADNYVEIDYHIQDNVTDVKLTIRNVLGVLVGEYGLANSGSKLHIDTSRLSAGVYFYTLSLHNKNVATKKLLIRN